MTRAALRIGRIVLGIAFLALGVAGLFLPFLQGILFIIVGLTLLSAESARARYWLERLRSAIHRRRATQLGEQSDGRG